MGVLSNLSRRKLKVSEKMQVWIDARKREAKLQRRLSEAAERANDEGQP